MRRANRPARVACRGRGCRLQLERGRHPEQSLAQTLAPQLAYLDADSSLAVAIDLRCTGDNWAQLRPLISRLLREYRSQADDGEVVPPNAEGALATLSSYAGLDFEKQVRPVLDGHLVI